MLIVTAAAIVLLLALGLTGPLSRRLGHAAAPIAYGGAFVACAVLAAIGVAALTGNGFVQARLPVGLPWIEARFRFDVLAGFFLAVVNLGGAMAALYGIGYGRHEHEP
ncbi:MAG: hydrogenase 4 subunit B, partial [Rhodospirillales bacterium]|nr:hydrogenase 4 subunit B [Rhodospirillales bacterium]